MQMELLYENDITEVETFCEVFLTMNIDILYSKTQHVLPSNLSQMDVYNHFYREGVCTQTDWGSTFITACIISYDPDYKEFDPKYKFNLPTVRCV